MELQFLDWLQQLHTPFLDRLMIGITHLGDVGMIWIVLTVVLLLIPKTRKSGIILAIALMVDALLCNGVLKLAFARTRPFEVRETVELLIAAPKDFSFPSGHTAAAFATVYALYLTKNRWLWKGTLVVALFMAFSRMYLYVHYPTDVLGGIVVGMLSAKLAYSIVTEFEKSRKREE